MLAGGLAPYLALAVKKATTDENNNVNMPANIAGHALAGAVVAYLQGGSVAGGAAGAAGGELAAHAIMAELYPNSTVDSLTSEQKANISALAGGVAGNSSNAIGSGAVAGKVAVENNALSGWENLPKGLTDYGAAAASWNEYAMDNHLTPVQTQVGLDKLAKGDLPEGANITKVIVNGYNDGVLIAGAAYLGPAVSVGKVVAGGAIA